MSETPTPETDSVTRSSDETPWTPWVCAGHAKRLERELDEAREELARLRKGLVRLIKRWKRREKEYLKASTDEWDTGDKYASRRYYGESIGTHWAIEDLELIAMKLIAKMKKEAK